MQYLNGSATRMEFIVADPTSAVAWPLARLLSTTTPLQALVVSKATTAVFAHFSLLYLDPRFRTACCSMSGHQAGPCAYLSDITVAYGVLYATEVSSRL